jgi:hypothetical protein
MALSTFSALKTAVALWLARPGDTLITGSIPDMVTLFEAEARRQLRNINNEATGTLTIAAGDSTVQMPSDFLELRSARISSVNPRVPLTFLTPDQFDSSEDADQTGRPEFFTIEDVALGPRMRFAPISDGAYTFTIRYYAALVALGNGTAQVNWLLTNHPDAYLFGTLAEAEAYIGHDERIGLWIQRRDASLASVNLAGRKALFGGGSLQIKTDTGNP